MSQSRRSDDILIEAQRLLKIQGQRLLDKLIGQNVPGKTMQQATVSNFL